MLHVDDLVEPRAEKILLSRLAPLPWSHLVTSPKQSKASESQINFARNPAPTACFLANHNTAKCRFLIPNQRLGNSSRTTFYLRAVQQYYLTTREGCAEAIRLAHRALELDPRFGSAAVLAGTCHQLDVTLGYANDPEFERKEAVRLLQLALSVDDDDPDTLARAANISAFMVGDNERELEMVDRAVALNPNSAIVWNCRGWVYRVAGQAEEALRSFEQAMRMSPVDAGSDLAFCGMSQALIELGRFDDAILAARKALRHNSSFPPAYRCLASAFALGGRDAEARDAAARLLEVDPAFSISAWVARGQRNLERLIEGLRKAGLPE